MRKNLVSYLVIGGIIAFASFMYYVNTSHEEEIFNNPKAGDYYVMTGLLQGLTGDQVYKVKEVKTDVITFYLPAQELIGSFKPNKTESVIREADKKGQMFSEDTVSVDREDLKKYRENSGFKGKVIDQEEIQLEYVFR